MFHIHALFLTAGRLWQQPNEYRLPVSGCSMRGGLSPQAFKFHSFGFKLHYIVLRIRPIKQIDACIQPSTGSFCQGTELQEGINVSRPEVSEYFTVPYSSALHRSVPTHIHH
ncbi:hypothetical protein A0H81_08884 [Grifola frondosa]|uniref:Uncharacterized protein n=1 Tax=Grifola frondosa TaxID=5627 RepID=A0A1C7M4B5_GRIFR|nr:hypothetical protein A0H81_08884 [Grifola frondosa]